jgi:hypothetical protein
MTKHPLYLILLSFILAAQIPAATVDFSLLPSPLDITNSPTTLSGVTFRYDMTETFYDEISGTLYSPSPCAFDGTSGFSFLGGANGCVGAQADSGGIIGTTDGSYSLVFDHQMYGLGFSFGLASFLAGYDGEAFPDGQTYGLAAVFYINQGTPEEAIVGVHSVNAASGRLDYIGSSFTSATIYFSPVTPVTDGSPLDSPFGQTLVSIYDVSEIPEPGPALLVGLGLIGLAGLNLRKRIP